MFNFRRLNLSRVSIVFLLISLFTLSCSDSSSVIEKKTFSGHVNNENIQFEVSSQMVSKFKTSLLEKAKKTVLETMKADKDGKISICVHATKNINVGDDTYNIEVCPDKNNSPECKEAKGCLVKLKLEDINLSFVGPRHIKAKIVLSDINWDLKISNDIDKNQCTLGVQGHKGNGKITLTIPATIANLPSRNNTLGIVINEMNADLDDLKVISKIPGIVCDYIESVPNLVIDQFKEKMPFGTIVNQGCLRCKNLKDCPDSTNQTCENITPNENDPNKQTNICMYQKCTSSNPCSSALNICTASYDTNFCIPKERLNGILSVDDNPRCEPISLPEQEYHLRLDSLFPLFYENNIGLQASGTINNVILNFATEAISLTAGVGIEPLHISDCVPDALKQRPPYPKPLRSAALLDLVNPVTAEKVDVGLGVHVDTLNYATWSLWASGGLCLSISSEKISLLRSGFLGALIAPSLLDIADPHLPVKILANSSVPPKITLGGNKVGRDNNGMQIVEEPLLNLKIEKFNLEFQIYSRGRWLHLFTVQANINLPVALQVHDQSADIVIGDIYKAVELIGVKNAQGIIETNEKLTENLKKLIESAVELIKPMLAGISKDLPSITIPEIGDYKITIDKGSIAAVDKNAVLGIFAKVDEVKGYHPVSLTDFDNSSPRLAVDLHDFSVSITDRKHRLANPVINFQASYNLQRGSVVTPISNQSVDYRFRVDGLAWSNFTRTTSDRIVVKNPLLSFEGDHVIEVAARLPDNSRTLSPIPAKSRIHIDYSAPKIARVGDQIVVTDAYSASTLKSRFRVVGNGIQPWTNWSATNTYTVSKSDTRNATFVEVEANDGYGNVATARIPLRKEASASASSKKERTPAAVKSSDSGCSNSGGSAPINLIPLLLFVAGLVTLRLQRSEKRRLLVVLLATTFGVVSGCKGETKLQVGENTPETEHAAGRNGGECLLTRCQSECNDGEKGFCGIDSLCHCQTKGTFPLGDYGLYGSIAGNSAGLRVAVVYNKTYGDLMVQPFRQDTLSDKWFFVDGVPEDNTPAFGRSNPRGGSIIPGEDAGKYTSTVVDDDGVIHIAYQGNERLKYARVKEDGSSEVFYLDKTPTSGLWTQIVQTNDKINIIYTVGSVGEKGSRRSEFRHIIFPKDAKNSDFELLRPKVIKSESIEYPCATECGGMLEFCITDEGVCGGSDSNCAERCGDGYVCRGSKCKRYYTRTIAHPMLAAIHTEAKVLGGKLKLVFYDGVDGLAYKSVYNEGADSWDTKPLYKSAYCTYASIASDSSSKAKFSCMNEGTRELSIVDKMGNKSVVPTAKLAVGDELEYLAPGEGVQLEYIGNKAHVYYQDIANGTIRVAIKDVGWRDEVVPGTERVSGKQTSYHGFYLDTYNDGTSVWILEQHIDFGAVPKVHRANLIKYP